MVEAVPVAEVIMADVVDEGEDDVSTGAVSAKLVTDDEVEEWGAVVSAAVVVVNVEVDDIVDIVEDVDKSVSTRGVSTSSVTDDEVEEGAAVEVVVSSAWVVVDEDEDTAVNVEIDVVKDYENKDSVLVKSGVVPRSVAVDEVEVKSESPLPKSSLMSRSCSTIQQKGGSSDCVSFSNGMAPRVCYFYLDITVGHVHPGARCRGN